MLHVTLLVGFLGHMLTEFLITSRDPEKAEEQAQGGTKGNPQVKPTTDLKIMITCKSWKYGSLLHH